MKAGIIYTSTTPELIELVNREVRKNLGEDAQIQSYEDPSILAARLAMSPPKQRQGWWPCSCRQS